MTSLCLIRHGQTAWNAEGRIQGQEDIPLSDSGVSELFWLGGILGTIKFDAVYSSPLHRALATAIRFTEDNRFDNVIQDARLKERHYGLWQGMLDSEVKEKYPITWNSNWRMCGPPGGESQSQLVIRAASFLDDVLGEHVEQRIAIVSHEGLLAAMLGYILKIPLEMHQTLRWDNCGYVWVSYVNGHPRLEFK